MCLLISSTLILLVGFTVKFWATVLDLYFISGHGLTLEHIRYNSECGVYEELEPIDENLKYDFDYQQFTYLGKEVTIQRVCVL